MATLRLNPTQIPDNSILDINGKQTYLGNAFICGTQSGSIGDTSETPYILITNPSTSKTSVFSFTRKHSIIVTSSAIATFRYYLSPTITANGTALTPGNLRVNAASPSSSINMYQAPTVSANGTFIADIATTSSGSPNISNILFILDPGQSVLITVTASSGSAPVAFEMAWYELPYTTSI